MDFTRQLLLWYQKNKRDLPWRNTTNPYYIWLSEIILQQTRIEQGLPYYLSFTENFPTLKDLATANEDDVLKLWQGLGYYSRARNLHFTAKTIYFDLNNTFPDNYNNIIKLKGIGPYTAAAIASFAYKEPVAVVDGNVFRVLSRFFGIHDDIAIGKNRTVFQNLANELISKKHPDLFNHAIMDFGATVCVPANPKCGQCILNQNCYAFLKNKVNQLPVKNKKITIKNRFFNYLILKKDDKIALQQRTDKDIWQQLYELPLVETLQDNEEDLFEYLSALFPESTIKKITPNAIKHKLSHQQLHISFYEIQVADFDTKHLVVPLNQLDLYAYPIVLWNFLKDFFKLEKN
ncbi:A/G-specific DNA-adenine glycosylase [Paenimyroides aquimaris]|uniref:Adenine DNA glycosylase n=1 Tax=Paenimyroides marinum TaxID=1159016 RepID=A0A1H6KIB2_9FLAO|nr:A/G-specific adenine glycosylase [Paenimyroides aquimaris]SEH74972.1 A/G-specific DNA-adenine glycosylase [Paenimyroides aquimaris]